MRAGQRPAAQFAVDPHGARYQGLDDDGIFPVPQLTDVVVVGFAVQAGLAALPTKENVARRLHEPLARDDPLAHVGVLAGTDEPAEHRRLSLLHLQEERVGIIAAEHQDDPAAGADTANPDNLAGYVYDLVLLEQVAAVGFHCPPVLGDQAGQLRLESGQLLFLGE